MIAYLDFKRLGKMKVIVQLIQVSASTLSKTVKFKLLTSISLYQTTILDRVDVENSKQKHYLYFMKTYKIRYTLNCGYFTFKVSKGLFFGESLVVQNDKKYQLIKLPPAPNYIRKLPFCRLIVRKLLQHSAVFVHPKYTTYSIF